MTFLKVEDLDEIRNRFGEKVSCWPAERRRLGADLSGRLLLRFHPKLLCLSRLSGGLWLRIVGHPWLFLSHICTSERTVVRDSGGVLETTGTRSERPLGRQRCRWHSKEEKRLQAREGNQRPGDWRNTTNLSCNETTFAAVTAGSICLLGRPSPWNVDCNLLRDRDLSLRSLQWAWEVSIGMNI